MPPPRSIGPFEILDQLGAGGMGEVFRARDTRLNREVAIKFLPETAGVAARQRFQREAQAIAALNHPHICTIYEVGDDRGQPYLVLELLEGESLYQRLGRGLPSAQQAAQWGSEIADALDAAHRKGILHRDLKPGNIFVTPRGSVKVLDFGLAQFAAAAATETDPATLAGTALAPGAPPLTTPGTLVGTYAYMSPEQARGEPSDARSDLFSLGVVLYEMAAGEAPFKGRTAADLSAAILTRTPPPPSSLRPPGSGEVPARLDDAIAQCLEKDPDLRYQSAADLRVSLRRALGPTSGATSNSGDAAAIAPAQTTPPPSRRRLWPLAAIALAIVLAAAAWLALRPQNTAPPQLAFRQLTFSGRIVDAVISPDGKFLAHVDLAPDGTSLHLQSVANGSDTQIMPPAPGCCQSPSFSPDGSMVYFLEDRTLKAVPVLGGAARTIADSACTGAGFSPDGGQIAYAVQRSNQAELWLAHPDGTQASVLNRAPTGKGYLSQCWANFFGPTHSPAWSPDGRWIAVEEGGASGAAQIVLVASSDGKAQPLGPPTTSDPTDFNWLADGSGLVMTANIPESATSQLWRLTYPGGKLTQLTNDLQGYASASLASTGTLALVHAAPQASIWVQNRAEFQQLPGGGVDQEGRGGLAWTSDGSGLVVLRQLGGQKQLWAEASDGSGAHALASVPNTAYALHVAPSGQIVFGLGGDNATVWRINGDGSGLTQLMALSPGTAAYAPSLALGGREVVYMLVDTQARQFLWGVPLAGGTPRQISTVRIYAAENPVSPDGTRVYEPSSTPDGQRASVIIRLDGGSPQVTTAGFDMGPRLARPLAWSPDGKSITYKVSQGSTDNIWARPIAGGPAQPLTHFTDLKISAYAFSKDGRLAVSRGSQNRDVVVATGLGGGSH